MKMREGEAIDIRYTKTGTDEVTDRLVIPTTVPRNIKAIDVTELTREQRRHLVMQYAAYRDYIRTVLATAFTFENFMAHNLTLDEDIEIKWRTFKPDQTEIL